MSGKLLSEFDAHLRLRRRISHCCLIVVEISNFNMLGHAIKFVLIITLVNGVSMLGCHPSCKICSPTKVVCENAKLNDETMKNLTAWIPRTVKEVRITGNQIHELPVNMFGNCSGSTALQYRNLKTLDLSGNQIKKIHGMTFHCLPNVETLSLADNNWVLHDHTGVFRHNNELKTLNLSNTFHDRYNNSIHVHKLAWVLYDCDMQLQFLDLSRNEFQVFTKEAAKALCTIPDLLRLDISRNNLTNPVLDECLLNLKFLDLSHNYIQTVSKEAMYAYDHIQAHSPHPHGLYIDFRHNEWDCDCHLRDFVGWIKTTNVTIYQGRKLSCHDGQHLNRLLHDIDPSQLQCVDTSAPAPTNANAGVVVIIVLLVIILCVSVVLMYIKRDRVKVYWKRATDPVKNAYLNRKSQFGYSSVSTINA